MVWHFCRGSGKIQKLPYAAGGTARSEKSSSVARTRRHTPSNPPRRVIKSSSMAKQLTYLKDYKDLNAPLSVAQLAVHFALLFGLIVGISSDLGSALIILFVFITMGTDRPYIDC